MENNDLCQCTKCGRMHRHLGNPPSSITDTPYADARNAVLEEAIDACASAAWKHVGDDAYSQGMDAGACHQVDECIKAIEALKNS